MQTPENTAVINNINTKRKGKFRSKTSSEGPDGLDGVGGQRYPPAALPLGERHGTHFTGGWLGPRDILEKCGKSLPTGIRSPDISARSKSLYQLKYSGPR